VLRGKKANCAREQITSTREQITLVDELAEDFSMSQHQETTAAQFG